LKHLYRKQKGYGSVELSSDWLAVGEDETAGISHGHRANQCKTRIFFMSLKMSGFGGKGKIHVVGDEEVEVAVAVTEGNCDIRTETDECTRRTHFVP
jgi:hypothetical protein